MGWGGGCANPGSGGGLVATPRGLGQRFRGLTLELALIRELNVFFLADYSPYYFRMVQKGPKHNFFCTHQNIQHGTHSPRSPF